MVAVIDGVAANQQEQELALNQQVTEIEFQAGAIVIDNDEDYQNAADFGRMLKQRASDVKDFWKPMKDAAHKAHAEICNKEKAMLQPLANAEKILKQTMGGYVAEQERKRREAEEAARKAAKEEAERKMQEAIALEASGDQTAAEAAVEEAEIMDNAAASVSVAAAKPKATGVSTKKDWEIVSIDSEKVPTTVMGIDIRPVDTAAVMRLIRMSKGQVSIPGIQFKEKVQMSFRK
jgi:hypothetical protein